MAPDVKAAVAHRPHSGADRLSARDGRKFGLLDALARPQLTKFTRMVFEAVAMAALRGLLMVLLVRG
jgi:hypothetical protein